MTPFRFVVRCVARYSPVARGHDRSQCGKVCPIWRLQSDNARLCSHEQRQQPAPCSLAPPALELPDLTRSARHTACIGATASPSGGSRRRTTRSPSTPPRSPAAQSLGTIYRPLPPRQATGCENKGGVDGRRGRGRARGRARGQGRVRRGDSIHFQPSRPQFLNSNLIELNIAAMAVCIPWPCTSPRPKVSS